MTSSMIRRTRSGFTLVELLIVIGIIGLLVAILIPTITAVKLSGYAADSAAQIKAIQASIMEYHNTFKAYPGPLAEDQLGPNPAGGSGSRPGNITGFVTGTENLVLGLLGGLERTGSGTSGGVAYNVNKLGNGPVVLGMTNKNYSLFYDDWARQISNKTAANVGIELACSTQDSNIPEFMDRFPSDELPILYLRARPGAPGIIQDSTYNEPIQYSMRSYVGYIRNGSTPLKPRGHDQGTKGRQGATSDGGWLGMLGSPAGTMQGDLTTSAMGYFKHPTLNTGSINGRTNGTPVAKDEYILISAGKDRTYGTSDDITSFSR